MSTLELTFGPLVRKAIGWIVSGEKREVCMFGTRGDGKTWGAFGAMVAHALEHARRGYPLPVKWLGIADTFESHKAKTHESLEAPAWQGGWVLVDGGHVAEFRQGGTTLVALRLVGVATQEDMNKLRAECVGVWGEEPAPASVLVQSSGFAEDAWTLALTSQRLPSHCHPAVVTSNYPDDDHWTWQRFVVRAHPGTGYVRIPPGELASASQREEWKTALANRPDLIARLLSGEPGTVSLGKQVAEGFLFDTHVAVGRRLALEPKVPVHMGHDGGHTPTTIVGQRTQGRVRVVASLASQRAGTRQHLRNLVLPWLKQAAPWVLQEPDLLYGWYDPSMDTGENADIDQDPVRVLHELLPGHYAPGAVSWPARIGPGLELFNAMYGGRPVLELDPVDAAQLAKALGGRWYYPTLPSGQVARDLPKKPNHPWEDLGDAFLYLVGGIAPSRGDARKAAPKFAATSTDPYGERRAALSGTASRGW